ncbi:hypothetical protein BZA70DRAFT_279444 [Myxozyma melibiosi]|uniref:UBL3-like ubiquitin domain-containing protein n=1 Tax=Myxozyma melibiosi TaxID=54550 RepID=A0ABR1F614_9ASCO
MVALLDSSVMEPDKNSVTPLHISLLMVSGLRYTLTIDHDYMASHSLMLQDPEELSVKSLKECIFADWKEDWGDRPTDVEYIRLIHFGRLLDDKDSLVDSQLSRSNMYNVLHMSVRPVSIAGGVVPVPTKSRSSVHAAADAILPRRLNTASNNRDNSSHHTALSTSNSTPTYDAETRTNSHSGGCGCTIL